MRPVRASRATLGAIGLQGAGSLATFLCAVVVAHTDGPVVQGAFNTLKAEIDLLVAAMLLGTPQALFFFLQRGLMSWRHAIQVSAVQALLAVVLSGVIYYVFMGHQDGTVRNILVPSFVGLAVGAQLLQNNLRGASLAYRSKATFGFISALPGVCLFVLVIVAVDGLGLSMDPRMTAPSAVFCVAYLVAAAFATGMSVAPVSALPAGSVKRYSRTAFLKYGISSWVPAVEQGLSLVIAFHLIKHRMPDAASVGIFSSALLTLLIFLTPMNFLVPLIFKRWIGLDDGDRIRELDRGVKLFGIVAPFIVFVIWLVEPVAIRLLFGSQYLSGQGVLTILSLSLLPQAVNKLSGVMLNSIGRPSLAVIGETIRLVTIVCLFTFAGITTVEGFAVAWVAGDCLGACIGWSIARSTGAGQAKSSSVR
jgi:O-antigen/teichoic acid export membrane protein